MNSKNDKIAYLRFRPHSTEVNLIFVLNHKDVDYGEINEEIIAVRQSTETVNDLFTHLRNKILKIIYDKQNKEVELDLVGDKLKTKKFPEVDVKLCFIGKKNKLILGHRLLKELEGLNNLKFSIFNYKYSVKTNVPHVENITLPEIIYAGHSVSPNSFKGVFVKTSMCKSIWFTSKDKVNWVEAGNEYNYNVKENDVDHYLKYRCIPVNENHEGIQFEVISENPVINMPIAPKCPFETRHSHTDKALKTDEFRVVSYNTLSCRYTQNQYDHCPAEYLAVDYRKQLIFKELIGYNADIICLQEVDNKIFSFYYRQKFKNLGYNAIYNKKGNKLPEGLAMFFKKERFKFGGSEQIVFNQEIKSNSMKNINEIIKSDSTIRDIFMYQVTSLQYCKVKSKERNELIILANTHLYYHPDAANVRLLQAAVCLKYLEQLYKREVKNANGKMKVSVLFCGDFNSLPDTDVYKFVTTGSIEYQSKTLDKNCETTLQHPFKFKSACTTTFFTNYTVDFKGCLDYIFYDNLECTGHVPFYPESILAENVAIPSAVFPSDHVALIANMKYQ